MGKTTYIHETTSLHCSDGELYISYRNDKNEDDHLIFNVEQLYKDLPFIIEQTISENKKMQKMYYDSIKESLKKL